MKVYKKNESNKSPHRIDFVPDAFEKLKNNLPTFVSNAIPDFHVSFITRMQKSFEKKCETPKKLHTRSIIVNLNIWISIIMSLFGF